MDSNRPPPVRTPRTLSFSTPRPMGWVYGHPQTEHEQIPWSWGLGSADAPTAGQVRLASAQGTVTIPPGLDVELVLNRQAATDLTPLQRLHSADLQILTAFLTSLTDNQLEVLHRFTDLYALNLASTMVTPHAVSRLPWLEQLHHVAYSGGSHQLTDATAAWFNRCINLRTLSIFAGDLCGDGLRPLLVMPHLHILRFGSTNTVTSEGWAIIGQLLHLTTLDLIDSNIKDADLVHIGQLTTLRELDLYRTGVRGLGLRFLQRLAQLNALRVSKIEDDGNGQVWTPLGEMTALEQLEVSASTFSSAALGHLARLSRLQTLKLARCKFGAAPPNLAWLRTLPKLAVFDVSETNVDDTSLGTLAVPQLHTLSLSRTKITNHGLSALQSLQRLRSLDLSYTLVTDTGLREIQSLHALQEVILYNTHVQGPGLRYLAQLPDLRAVWIGGNVPVDPECTRYLQPHSRLQECHILGPGATGQTLRYLQPCQHLRALTLTAITLNVDDLEFLQRFPWLESLDLSGSTLPEAGIELLQQLGQLEYLYLAETNLSRPAINLLEEQLPNCSVIGP